MKINKLTTSVSHNVGPDVDSKPPSEAPLGPGFTGPVLVNNQRLFAEMLNHLQTQPRIALDTESDSLFRYTPKVCLIQLSVPNEPENPDPAQVLDYLVDPLRLDDLAPLGTLFANPACEVIMHAAENDMLTLQRDFGLHFGCIFDTQLAARILGWPRVGLAALLEEHFGVISNKQMQRTNWGQRPLTPQQIAYAKMDTHYLPALRAKQIEQLQANGHWVEAEEAFSLLVQNNRELRPLNERSFWQMSGTREVPRDQLAVLQALWEWREAEAQRLDRPPFKVMGDDTLMQLTTRQPRTTNELRQINGVGEVTFSRYGTTLLAVLAEGKRRPVPAFPPSTLRPEQMMDVAARARYDALRAWRTSTAESRGVAPEIIFANSTLLELAQRMPQNEAELLEFAEIGPWKVKSYGAALLRLLHQRSGK